MAERKSTPTPRWTVTVVPPRKRVREKNWQLLARCRVDGKTLEHRETSKTEDRQRAEQLARIHEEDLNAGHVPGTDWTVLAISEARACAFEAEGRAAAASRLRAAVRRLGIFGALTDKELDRAAILRARDALLAAGLEPSTAKTCFGVVAAAWRWGLEREHVRTPWPSVKALRCRSRSTKRPFTDAEVARLLAWSETYQRGRWAVLLHLAADTGRRIGELVRLRGRDVRRDAGVIELGRTKTGEIARVPVPAATLARLPQVEPDAFLWPARPRKNRGAAPGHVSNGAVRHALQVGVKAIGIEDAERLDTHSLRRAFVATAERAGIACDVGRRVTGHASRQMWDLYQAQAVGDNVRAVVDTVHDVRARALHPAAGPTQPQPASTQPPRAEPAAALEHAHKLQREKPLAVGADQIDFFIR